MRIAARLGAYAASAALVITGVTLTASPVNAATDPRPADDAAAWVAGQLTNGIFGGTCSYDCGPSLDAALSFIATARQPDAVAAAKASLPSKVNGYISGDSFGDTGSTYAGALAKSLTFAEAAGLDASSYGGVNLVTRLENQVTTSGANAGRIADTSAYGDFANTFGQAFATRGLAQAGSPRAGAVEDFLLKQQCSNGGFRQDFSAVGDASQSCTDPTKASVDTTATALIQLEADQTPSAAASAAILQGKTYLRNTQAADGHWGGGDGTSPANSNSTGLAAQALGDGPEAQRAAAWLRGRQVSSADACGSLASERGAIAYNDDDLAAARTSGIATAKRDSWRRASAQAFPGLTFLQASAPSTAPSLLAPSGYLKGGSRSAFTVSGLADGADACLAGPGVNDHVTSSGTTISRTVTLPAGTATRTYTLTDEEGRTDTRAVKVLGAKTIPVGRSKYRVHRGRFVTVTLTGLAPGERAAVYYKGVRTRTGAASSTGVFKATFRVGRAKGVKQVVGVGQFGDIRRGTTTIRVVR